MTEFIEESTTPFTGKYQEQAKRIERRYKTNVAITTVFIILMGGMAVYDLLAWLVGHDFWYALCAVISGLVCWSWSRDYARDRRRRAEDYVRLTNHMAFDMNVQRLIEHEEDNQ